MRGIGGAALLAALALLLGACGFAPSSSPFSQPRVPHPTYKVGGPYTVNGVTYYPRVDYDYDHVGLASWYGQQFQGRYTANGEVFDLNAVTAAHKTLPLPSIVEVVNLQNNRALHIRVNDRGPFVEGRVIDLSRRAAQLLGFERSGTAPVRVRVLREPSLRTAALAQRGIVGNGEDGTITLASAAPVVPRSPAAASTQPPYPMPPPAEATAAAGAPRFFVEDPVYRVQAGPVATQDQADRLRARLIANGYRDARIVMN
jgi:peptidoglycan lytic transglycosylase